MFEQARDSGGCDARNNNNPPSKNYDHRGGVGNRVYGDINGTFNDHSVTDHGSQNTINANYGGTFFAGSQTNFTQVQSPSGTYPAYAARNRSAVQNSKQYSPVTQARSPTHGNLTQPLPSLGVAHRHADVHRVQLARGLPSAAIEASPVNTPTGPSNAWRSHQLENSSGIGLSHCLSNSLPPAKPRSMIPVKDESSQSTPVCVDKSPKRGQKKHGFLRRMIKGRSHSE